MELSEELKDFVKHHISSIQQLNVLLVVISEPNRAWTAGEVAQKLNVSETAASTRLLSLCVKGLVKANEKPGRTFVYHPDSHLRNQMVQNLFSAYEKSPAPLLEFIYSIAENQLRDFSDAFRIIREEKND
jgi:predicted transcriptional regulator